MLLLFLLPTARSIMVAGPRAAILEEEEGGSGIRMDLNASGAAPPAPDGNVMRNNRNFYLVSMTIILGFPSSLVNDTLGSIFTFPHRESRGREAGPLPSVPQGRTSGPGCPTTKPRLSHAQVGPRASGQPRTEQGELFLHKTEAGLQPLGAMGSGEDVDVCPSVVKSLQALAESQSD